eukprot:TRINITY_DN2741_c0_g1_i1.p1 TRINITY_DN2741_c0_g1~~TRINITY_DN2741_c0_g1_i1.p1  ORF type:complete len:840 (+),score=152.61 TRINITY_DN2741_c0_g1_i1:47-2566(+)
MSTDAFADLCVSAEKGDVASLERLLLHTATTTDDAPHALSSLSNRHLLTRKDRDGDTALHIVCRHGRTRALLFLLTTEAVDVNLQNHAAQTAAHVAALNGFDGLVLWLMRKGADVHTLLDATGKSVYDVASDELKSLIEDYDPIQLDIPQMTKALRTNMHRSGNHLSGRLFGASPASNLPALSFLDETDSDDEESDIGVVGTTGSDESGEAQSCYAGGSNESTDTLAIDPHSASLEHPRNPRLPAIVQSSDEASMHSILPLLQQLMSQRDAPQLPNISLDQMEDLLAFLERQLKPAAFPKSRVANKSQKRLCDATRENDLESVRYLVEVEGIDIHAHDVEGKNPLHICCDYGFSDIAEYLLEKGADPNREEEYMNTPLLIASNKGHPNVVEVLLKRGANPKYKGLFGHAALLLSAEMGYLDIVKLLIQFGADVNVQDADGYSALHYAAMRRHDEVAIFLIDQGANVWLQNLDGKIPFQLASDKVADYITEKAGKADFEREQQSYSSILLGGRNHLEIEFSELSILGQIGKGSQGTVYKGIFKDSVVALKMLEGEWQNIYSLQLLSNEIYMLSMIKHPNVLQLHGACTASPHLILVVDLISKGNLSSLIYDQNLRLTKDLQISILWGVANGIFYLHQRSIVHRDLRCANILIDGDWTPKLCDFGLSCQVTDIYVGNPQEKTDSSIRKRMHSMYRPSVGALRWMAPEAFQNVKYDLCSDVYSFGMVVWEILHSKPPFDELSPTQAAVAAADGQRPSFLPETCEILQGIASRCWSHESSDRPSIKEVEQLLDRARNPDTTEQESAKIETPAESSLQTAAPTQVDVRPPRVLPKLIFTCEDDD